MLIKKNYINGIYFVVTSSKRESSKGKDINSLIGLHEIKNSEERF